ncbi:MAG: pilus assembly protein N-terminal domain-containing protein [Candidatus Omnitrophica bacterium]|nr:pilus assembly protein N-terminal domain-containing protein [Candidatus Omnitrophota bacterium]
MDRVPRVWVFAAAVWACAAAAVGPSADAAERQVTVKQGQTTTASFTKQVQDVAVSSANPEIATGKFRDDNKVVIAGGQVGRTSITVSGQVVRYQAGTNIPLQENVPFSVTFQVIVVPSTGARTQQIYQSAKSLLQFIRASLAAKEARWLSAFQGKVGEDVSWKIKDYEALAQRLEKRLEQNFEWLKKGTIREEEFLHVAFDLVRSGIKTAWQADLDEAKYEVVLVKKAHAQPQDQVSNQWYTSGGLKEEEREKLKNSLAAKEAALAQEALKSYAGVAKKAALARRVQGKEAWRWHAAADQFKLKDEMKETERFIYEQFAYDLGKQPRGLLIRLFGFDHGLSSTLDLFVNTPGSPDRLVLGFTVLPEEKASQLAAPHQATIEHVEGLRGLFKMNPVFRTPPVEAMREGQPGQDKVDPTEEESAGPVPLPPDEGSSKPPGETPGAPPDEEEGLPPPKRKPTGPREETPPPPPPPQESKAPPEETPQEKKEESEPVEEVFEALDFARIMVRSANRSPSLDQMSLTYLTKDQPFFVDVWLSQDEAAKAGKSLTVTFETASGKTGTLTLASHGGFRGPVFYTTDSPLTFSGGGSGGGKWSLLGFEFSRGGLSKLATQNGELVRVTSGGLLTEAAVFDTPEKLRIAHLWKELHILEAFYEGVAQDSTQSAEIRGFAGQQLKMLANANILMSYVSKPDDKFYFNDYTRVHIGEAYLNMAGTDPSIWDHQPGWGKISRTKGPDPRFPGVEYLTGYERHEVDLSLEAGERQWKDKAFRSIANLTVDLYEVYVSSTGVDQVLIVAYGITPRGERVSGTDRLMAGVRFGSQLVLGAAAGRWIAAKIQKMEEGPFLRGAAAPPAGRKGGSSIRIGKGAKDAEESAVIVSARPVHEDVTMPGATMVLGSKGSPGKSPGPGSGGQFSVGLQVKNDTCGLGVIESCRRDAGLAARTEAQNLERASWKGFLYKAGEGMRTRDVAVFLHTDGAKQILGVQPGKIATLRTVERELIRGRQVVAIVNVAGPGRPAAYHWVRVKEIGHHADGRNVVQFGDPWNGNVWEMDARAFAPRMHGSTLLSIEW